MQLTDQEKTQALESAQARKESLQVGSNYLLGDKTVLLMAVAPWQGESLAAENYLWLSGNGSNRVADIEKAGYDQRYPVAFAGTETELEASRGVAVYRVIGQGFGHEFITLDDFEAQASRKKHVSDAASARNAEASIPVPQVSKDEAIAFTRKQIRQQRQRKGFEGLTPSDS